MCNLCGEETHLTDGKNMGKESTFTLMMETAAYVDTLEQLQHTTGLIPKVEGTHQA
jgi:hypothetical protein